MQQEDITALEAGYLTGFNQSQNEKQQGEAEEDDDTEEADISEQAGQDDNSD